jgi:hypothetical protein
VSDLTPTQQEKGQASFQERVWAWMRRCFSSRIQTARKERVFRFLEEANELAQSLGMTANEARLVVDYVWGRDIGEPGQEVGGTMVTLAALCANEGIDLDAEAERELCRINRPEIIKKIRAKQDAKSAVGMGMSTKEPSHDLT